MTSSTSLFMRVRGRFLRIAKKLDWLPPLLVRICLGVVFIQSGWGKLHNLAGTAENFAGWHIPFPYFNAVLASATEFTGGVLVLLGLGIRLAGLPLAFVMVIAIISAKISGIEDWSDPFGWDESLYLAVFLWFVTAGAGKASLDHLIARRWPAPTESAG
jgi:putative oxidoreductase